MESSYSGNEIFAGNVVPAPISSDWKNNQLIADANGYIHEKKVEYTFKSSVRQVISCKVKSRLQIPSIIFCTMP